MDEFKKIEIIDFSISHLNVEVNWTIGSSEIFGLVGSNGSGKTTLLKQIAGLNHSIQESILGKILWNHGQDINQWTQKTRSNHIQYVSHDLWTGFPLKTLEVLKLGLDLGDDSDALIEDSLQNSPLRSLLERPFQYLSTGQRQLVLAWKALLGPAKLIFFDETFSMMDFEQKARMARLLKEHQKKGKSFVIVSHDWSWINFACNRIFQISDNGIQPIEKEYTKRCLSPIYQSGIYLTDKEVTGTFSPGMVRFIMGRGRKRQSRKMRQKKSQRAKKLRDKKRKEAKVSK